LSFDHLELVVGGENDPVLNYKVLNLVYEIRLSPNPHRTTEDMWSKWLEPGIRRAAEFSIV